MLRSNQLTTLLQKSAFEVQLHFMVAWKALWVGGNLREDVADIGVVGAAERWWSIAAVLQATFALSFTAAWNTQERFGETKSSATMVHKNRQVTEPKCLLNDSRNKKIAPV